MAFDGGNLILIKFTYMFSTFIARWPVSRSKYLWAFELEKGQVKSWESKEISIKFMVITQASQSLFVEVEIVFNLLRML